MYSEHRESILLNASPRRDFSQRMMCCNGKAIRAFFERFLSLSGYLDLDLYIDGIVVVDYNSTNRRLERDTAHAYANVRCLSALG